MSRDSSALKTVLKDVLQRPAAQRVAKTLLTGLWVAMRPVAWLGRGAYRYGMRLEFSKDWRFPPNPEWFNHELDVGLFFEWRKPHLFERGVYASEVCRGRRVLDLCCGDGSVAALFISPLAREVVGVDFDPAAIRHASRTWAHVERLGFKVMDIRNMEFPPGSFDAVLWDAAIEHFTVLEMETIIGSIKAIVGLDGVLHGSTIKRGPEKQHHEHEYEFASLEEMERLLSKHFTNVQAWERTHPDRIAFYFRCSDRRLPDHELEPQ